MSTHKAAGGKASQHVSPSGKRLGVKLFDGQKVSPGMMIIKQRGTKIGLGKGVATGRDHTIYAIAKGLVKFGKSKGKRMVSVKALTVKK
jgi:large subunit ribosomal protein L27